MNYLLNKLGDISIFLRLKILARFFYLQANKFRKTETKHKPGCDCQMCLGFYDLEV